ncbi:hypothetical protein BH23GEM2_BH23GEM2_15540 [soil metagenome]
MPEVGERGGVKRRTRQRQERLRRPPEHMIFKGSTPVQNNPLP